MPKIEWGILIVNYLFLGGLSAGIYFIAALATYLQEKDETAYARIARYGAMMAPWPVALGSLLLIFDLGNWWRFYKLFVHFRWQSPMSIGSWLLLLFTALTLVNFWAWLPEERRTALVARLRLPRWLDRDLAGSRRLLAAAGFPLSVGVAIYTGVLLGAVQARPFWNTNLVAQMFLFSALSTGCGVLILALSLNRKRLDATQLRFLYTLDICLITLEFFIVLPYLLHGELSVEAVRNSLALILGGPYTLVFWLLFMGTGLLVPLAIEVWEIAPALGSGAPLHHNRRLAALAAVLVVCGGYLLRYIFVYAGQLSSFSR
ncbi:MAG: polysulfide reductase NrfD [Acidobacteriia bacterium]|nr:polysulfide reductase NrfD [Terriglobia bacterium]